MYYSFLETGTASPRHGGCKQRLYSSSVDLHLDIVLPIVEPHSFLPLAGMGLGDALVVELISPLNRRDEKFQVTAGRL